MQQIPASKQLKIDKVPNILLIHLKRFAYDANTGGIYKVRKEISYGPTITLSQNWTVANNTKETFKLIGGKENRVKQINLV